MYEKMTGYLDSFTDASLPEGDLQKKLQKFAADFAQSGLVNPEGMMIMGIRGWATRSALRNDAPTMTGEEVCACLSAFVEQESFCPGILLSLVKEEVLPRLLARLKELDG